MNEAISAACGTAAAAFCIWLTIRIINNHERWPFFTPTFAIAGFVFIVLMLGCLASLLEHFLRRVR